mgnify:CR=1 FL=1
MKNAAVVLGILGGILGMVTGFFVYGYVEFLGWFNAEVEQSVFREPENAGRLVAVGIVSPVLALAGGAMAHPRPVIDSILRNPDAMAWTVFSRRQTSHASGRAVGTAVWCVMLGRQLGFDRQQLEGLGEIHTPKKVYLHDLFE